MAISSQIKIRDTAYELPRSVCPKCGHEMDRATGVSLDDEVVPKPEPGDSTICISCGEWLKFNGDLSLSRLTEEDIGMLSDEQFLLLQRIGSGLRKIKAG